jgi:quercetin dioxygenase-like cupin family protein
MTTHPGAGGATDFLRLAPGDERWEPAFELGISAMAVTGDTSKSGIYVIRVKWPPNVMSLPHTHPEDRHVTVLSGTWWAGTGETFDPDLAEPMTAGSYMLHPAGMVHWDGAKSDDCVIEIVGYGPSALNPIVPSDNQFTRI